MAEKKKRVSATSAILDYMRAGNVLTTSKAAHMFGCTRLPNHIQDLEKRGHIFTRDWVYGENRYGNPSKWIEFRYVGEREH